MPPWGRSTTRGAEDDRDAVKTDWTVQDEDATSLKNAENSGISDRASLIMTRNDSW